MTTVNGLPAHVLLVHAVVVLVPLTSLVIVLVAFWPAARRRLAIPAAVLGVVTLVAVPLTTEAGEWLEHRLPESELLRAHTELGDGLLPWAIGLALVGIAVGAREVLANRTARAGEDVPGPRSHARTGERGGRVVSLVLAVLAVVVAVGATVTTYEIGDSGSRAAWTGQFSPTPLQQPGPPRPDDDG